MTLLKVLAALSPVVTISANVAIFYNVFPAFKKTRNRAFLLLGFAALLGTFDTVCDWTIADDLYRKAPLSYQTYRVLRRCTYFIDCALGAAGIIMLARAALAGAEGKGACAALTSTEKPDLP